MVSCFELDAITNSMRPLDVHTESTDQSPARVFKSTKRVDLFALRSGSKAGILRTRLRQTNISRRLLKDRHTSFNNLSRY